MMVTSLLVRSHNHRSPCQRYIYITHRTMKTGQSRSVICGSTAGQAATDGRWHFTLLILRSAVHLSNGVEPYLYALPYRRGVSTQTALCLLAHSLPANLDINQPKKFADCGYNLVPARGSKRLSRQQLLSFLNVQLSLFPNTSTGFIRIQYGTIINEVVCVHRHHAMKAYREVDVHLRAFLTSALRSPVASYRQWLFTRVERHLICYT
jgi:hypothetical protein